MRRHSKRIIITLPAPHLEWLKREAARRGMKPMTLLRSLVTQSLEAVLPPPPPPRARCSLDLAPGLHQALQARARALGYPSSAALVRAIVREHADPLGRAARQLGFPHTEELLNSIACGETAILPLPEEHFRHITWLRQAARSADPSLEEFLTGVAQSMEEALRRQEEAERREEEEYGGETPPHEADLRERMALLEALLASPRLSEEVARDLRRHLEEARKALEESREED